MAIFNQTIVGLEQSWHHSSGLISPSHRAVSGRGGATEPWASSIGINSSTAICSATCKIPGPRGPRINENRYFSLVFQWDWMGENGTQVSYLALKKWFKLYLMDNSGSTWIYYGIWLVMMMMMMMNDDCAEDVDVATDLAPSAWISNIIWCWLHLK